MLSCLFFHCLKGMLRHEDVERRQFKKNLKNRVKFAFTCDKQLNLEEKERKQEWEWAVYNLTIWHTRDSCGKACEVLLSSLGFSQ